MVELDMDSPARLGVNRSSAQEHRGLHQVSMEERDGDLAMRLGQLPYVGRPMGFPAAPTAPLS